MKTYTFSETQMESLKNLVSTIADNNLFKGINSAVAACSGTSSNDNYQQIINDAYEQFYSLIYSCEVEE